ncbi:MAG: xylulose 5-phosphate 3-epimerase [Dehalococcoidia bacterium]|nr:xylulose 5-phosphate 3-epimerase [Dehalococcoidia bacterium]
MADGRSSPREQAVASVRRRESVEAYRRSHPEAERWAAGYGVIAHSEETQARVFALAEGLGHVGVTGDGVPIFDLLHAADRVASAGMWLVVHQTYARHVYTDGRELAASDFRAKPEGHTGGSLNMVPAYVGYFAANALSGLTRSWIMGQGHCVSAIDSVNLLLDNMLPEHAARYDVSDEGLTRYVQDFYSYRLGPDSLPASPLGSHMNQHTAGAMSEGGYLGFTELEYVHMPLPGQRLVVFLSDGAFEEQRGSDWAPRWWRGEDSGLVAPIMINNGRRIDQRTTLSQQGGADWLSRHQKLNGFAPFVIDGKDPAAFVWAILEIEGRLKAASRAIEAGELHYPAPLPYAIAVAPKGAGFANAGTNLAHNLPLMANPHLDAMAAETFNRHARRLWVAPAELRDAVACFQRHEHSQRPAERDHPLVRIEPPEPELPPVDEERVPADRGDIEGWRRSSPMEALDRAFARVLRANPALRPRVGNPDEMRSNRLLLTLDLLKFRVTEPEPGMPEAVGGGVVTALNEEAVAAAALGNKGGINLIATYEAFGAKMHGIVRQELTFTASALAVGRPMRWPSVPLVLTSHTWENSKNETSHQDPSMAELMLNEASHVSRVIFPPDANTTAAVMDALFRTRGQIWTLVVPKGSVASLVTGAEARQMVEEGGLRLEWAGHRPDEADLVLTAMGAYQLEEVLHASRRLAERGVDHAVNYLLEPGRFRAPRDPFEAAHVAGEQVRARLFPGRQQLRLFVGHTRPEPLQGVLRPLDTGPASTRVRGFINQGGTLDVRGLLFRNRCNWAHLVRDAAELVGRSPDDLLEEGELAAIEGRGSPHGSVLPESHEA